MFEDNDEMLEEILPLVDAAINLESKVWKYMLEKGYVQRKVEFAKRIYDEFRKEFPEEYALDLAKWYISTFKIDSRE